jgi:diphthamide biosynthesis protein 7
VATSTGSIDTYQLVDAYDEAAVEPGVVPRISHVKTHQYFPEDVLVTVFSWHPTSPAVGMSLSSGEISLASTTGGTLNATVFTHDLEAWTLAFLPDGMGLYSGGDDSVLAYRDLPANFESVFETDNDSNLAEETPQWKDKRIHGAGVTGILPLHTQGERHLVLTGSYDDCIRLIDAPVSGRRKVLAEMNLGGGVWRLKRLDVSPDIPAEEQTTSSILLLASCMHAGARIVRLFRTEEEDWTFEVLAKFEEHKSMNYGSDCQPQVTEKGQRTFITTSFYDRLLCLWRF